jgi:hypothetical protein
MVLPFEPTVRLPFEPVERVLRKTSPLTVNQIAEALGTAGKNVLRWRVQGLSIRQADKIAVGLGFHPYQLWGDSFYEGAR